MPAPAVEHVKGNPVTHYKVAGAVNVTERSSSVEGPKYLITLKF